MTASTPRELQERFDECFLADDLDGLLSLYEDAAVSSRSPARS